jgi:hypothetical protein
MIMEAVPTSNGGGEQQNLIKVEAMPTSDYGGDTANI